MAGRIRQLIDELIELRTRGQPELRPFVRAHLMMKGIHPDRYDLSSPDDRATIELLERLIHDYQSANQ